MSDGDYDGQGSDDDIEDRMNGAGPATNHGKRPMVSRPKDRAQARWEAAATSNWELRAAHDGDIQGVLGGIDEADKRKRYVYMALW